MFSSNTTQVSDGGYQISRSLRFNSADSAYLNRTPASASNRKTWTWSAWVKRSNIVNRQILLEQNTAGTDEGYFGFELTSDAVSPRIAIGGWNTTWRVTTQVFRDVSAWYHIVLAVDTTQATANNRIRLYVNGVEVTSFSTLANPTQNADTGVNSTGNAGLGASTSGGSSLSGYMTEVNFIDGQALTPSSFGETNAQTGVWQPKAYSGSYGTNGFYLNFSDNSNTTAATLGKDYSGNGNNWTPNNFSVTAGAGNDSLVDSPTSYGVDTGVGGTVRGNYATLNPLDKGSNITLANGNLDWSGTLAGLVRGTIAAKSDKYYFECVASTSYFLGFALASSAASLSCNPAAGAAGTTGYWGWAIDDNSNIFYFFSDGTNPFTVGRTTSAGDVYQLAVDATSSSSVKLWVGVNNTWYNSSGGTTGDPATGANPTVTITSGVDLFPSGCNTNSTNAVSMNFGQRPFAYTAPSGFKALCTQNLPTPTIGATTATQAGKYFNPVLYMGTGSAQSISGVGFQPDWTWLKARSAAYTNLVTDAVRGAGKSLYTNATDAETTNDANGYVTSFDSSGFGISNGIRVNANGINYVAWNWKANGAGSTNTAGSITSTVSANTTSGFSVVTYTGTGANATVGHGLGVAPKMVITKNRSASVSWLVYHASLGPTVYLLLNATDSGGVSSFAWNNTSPTSSVFSLGSSQAGNGSSENMVAYCFAEVAGYSKIGIYTGNNSGDGPFVFTGMRPSYVMVKASSSTGDWIVEDGTRNPTNVVNAKLSPNTSSAEFVDAGAIGIDFLSNGFKIRGTDTAVNGSGVTYIFMALAQNPFKYSLAR